MIPLKNRTLLSMIYVGSAVTTILCASFILFNPPSLLVEFHNIATIAIMTIMTIPFFIRVDIFKLIKLRTYSDHIIVASSVVLQTTPQAFIYFYVVVIWIQSFVNTYILNADQRISVFLRTVPLLVCIYSVLFLQENLLAIYLFMFGVGSSTFIFYSLEKTMERQRSLENAAQAVKEVQHRILIHNIRNQSNQLLLKLSNDYPELENSISSTFEQIIDSVGGIAEEASKRTDIFILTNRMAAYFNVNYSLKFNIQIRSTPALLHEQLFLSALYVFFSNSYEANANRIKITREGDLLSIVDNGSGFDTSKIGRGFTTKTYGRGIGLVSALEACEKIGLVVKIESSIGNGTKITLDISKVAINQ
jgi:hypothetical protein